MSKILDGSVLCEPNGSKDELRLIQRLVQSKSRSFALLVPNPTAECLCDMVADENAEHELWHLCCMFEYCESPIERLLLAAMMIWVGTDGRIEAPGKDEFCWNGRSWSPRRGRVIRLQQQIGKYRVDFVVSEREMEEEATVVVECDGHDFHERTKKQAQHDRFMDRRLQADGYGILRFTGSEVWKDPFACVEEIMLFLEAAIGDKVRKRSMI